MSATKGVIGILTGGGDVPGLNPAIRATTLRALAEGYSVIGFKRGFAGLMDIIRNNDADNSNNFVFLTEDIANRIGRTGGTFLHTSRVNPLTVKKEDIPEHLKDKYTNDINDMTEDIIANLHWLNIDYLIPLGGNDTLSYAVRLYEKGIKVIGIPKTMDNDVPGTDYSIGFSTCVTRINSLSNIIRTSADSHERFLVIEVFGRYSGFTAMLPTLAGAANRCVIPEHPFNLEHLTELMVNDRLKNPNKYSIVLVSEGATYEGRSGIVTQGDEKDEYGNPKLGGIGDEVARHIKNISPKFNKGFKINAISQRLGYLVRGGDPDTIDSIVPIAFGNMVMELILKGVHGRLMVIKNGRYDNVPIDVVTSRKKVVDVRRFYDTERLRPKYKSFEFQPLLVLTGE